MIWRGILIHSTQDSDSNVLALNTIRTQRFKGRPWARLKYHFVVEKIDHHYYVLAGRSMILEGGACEQTRRSHLDVALAGNFSRTQPPPEQMTVASNFVASLCSGLWISPNRVALHSEYEPGVGCPGQIDIQAFRTMVIRSIGSGGGQPSAN